MDERRTAIVTGGSRGIGRAICLDLAGRGLHVVINYRANEQAAQQTLAEVERQGGSGELCPFDVADAEQVGAALGPLWQRTPALEVLVNNAGVTADGLMAMMPPEDWWRVLRTSLGGFYNVTKPALMRMVGRKRGSIVTISSASGVVANRGQTNYSAAKSGLIGASRTLAAEVARLGVRVNVVAPGIIDTDMTKDIPKNMLRTMIPMGRMGRPEEVARVVGWLCSDEASYITGQVINVNGGLV